MQRMRSTGGSVQLSRLPSSQNLFSQSTWLNPKLQNLPTASKYHELSDEARRYADRQNFNRWSEVCHIRRELYHKNITNWGHVLYRCDYSNNHTWEKFMANVEYEHDQQLEIFRVDDLRKAMVMPVVEDKEALAGATLDQARKVHREWLLNDHHGHALRCTYFVHVDAGSIDSVVNRAPQPPERDIREIGYATLVKMCPDVIPQDEDENEDFDEDEWWLMGSVRVPISYLGPEMYGDLWNDGDGFWWERLRKDRRHDEVSCGGDPCLYYDYPERFG